MMNIHAILKQLPHRYPFLLVDKVVELERNARILAVKNVTFNEPFFMGHFPGRPVMPGVLMLEALAQAAGLLAFDAMGQVPDENNIYYFVGIDSARFKRPVEPGDSCFWKPRLIAFEAEFGNLKVLHVSAMKSLAKPS